MTALPANTIPMTTNKNAIFVREMKSKNNKEIGFKAQREEGEKTEVDEKWKLTVESK